MRKHSLVLVVLLSSIIAEIGAQDCLPDGIRFSTQEEIDAFSFNNPGCMHILGAVIVEEFADGGITNLVGLSQIQSIGGYLRVFFNDSLSSLRGLDNVRSIGKYLLVTDNDALTSLTGLDNLTSIGEEVFLSTNDALTNLHGLDNLLSIGGYLLITGNTGLTNLSGLDKLTSIGSFLFIDTNTALTSLNGLEQLTTLGGALAIRFQPFLTSLNALNNLTSIGGSMHLGDNDVLTTLSGLDNIDPATISELILEDSPELSICEIMSICAYLNDPINPATITGNASGCNTRAEVEAACEIVSGIGTVDGSLIEIYPNPTLGSINISGVSDGQIVVMNSLGSVIRDVHFEGSEVDISALPDGLYYIQVCSGERCAATRVIKR